jgi:hypothetical protein
MFLNGAYFTARRSTMLAMEVIAACWSSLLDEQGAA